MLNFQRNVCSLLCHIQGISKQHLENLFWILGREDTRLASVLLYQAKHLSLKPSKVSKCQFENHEKSSTNILQSRRVG